MKRLVIILFMLVCGSMVFSQESKPKQTQMIKREKTEWCDIWIPSAPETDKPRILLMGDSITKAYYRYVSKLLEDYAYCTKFTTSACVTDPAFYMQLETMFSQYEYEIIHFNNGLHGFDSTEEEYQIGYEKALQYIQQKSPASKIILVLSTSADPDNDKHNLNPRIDERNRIVRELGAKYGLGINDLHTISALPEYYANSFHYNAVGIKLQSKHIAGVIKNLLRGNRDMMSEP